MQSFSVETAGFVALTLTELMLQEFVKKGLLSGQEVKHLLVSAALRHEDAAEGDQEKIDLNMEAAHMIRTLMNGLAPLFSEENIEQSKIETKAAESVTGNGVSVVEEIRLNAGSTG